MSRRSLDWLPPNRADRALFLLLLAFCIGGVVTVAVLTASGREPRGLGAGALAALILAMLTCVLILQRRRER